MVAGPVKGRGSSFVLHAKHLLDGRDASDGLFGELADAVGQSAQQLAVNVYGAAAHAGDHSAVLGFRSVQAGEDHVLAGTDGVVEHAQYLHLHDFGLGALEDGPCDRMHAGPDIGERENCRGVAHGGSGGDRCRDPRWLLSEAKARGGAEKNGGQD